MLAAAVPVIVGAGHHPSVLTAQVGHEDCLDGACGSGGSRCSCRTGGSGITDWSLYTYSSGCARGTRITRRSRGAGVARGPGIARRTLGPRVARGALGSRGTAAQAYRRRINRLEGRINRTYETGQ